MKISEDNLGFAYIAEQVSPEENKVEKLTYNDSASAVFAEFDTCLHSFGRKNRNGRGYLGSNVEENLKTERIQSMLRTNAWFGEQDHPTEEEENAPLSPQRIKLIKMPNRSHKIMRPQITGDLLHAHIQTSSGTEAGRGMALDIIQGLIPTFSCRAIGALQMINGLATVIIHLLITYDWVLYPSHKEAEMEGTPVMTSKTLQMIRESTDTAYDNVARTLKRFKKYSESVYLPLEELFHKIGNEDVSTQLILESFDLDESAIAGISPDLNQIIIKDNNNQYYANISPQTKNEVRDFLASF